MSDLTSGGLDLSQYKLRAQQPHPNKKKPAVDPRTLVTAKPHTLQGAQESQNGMVWSQKIDRTSALGSQNKKLGEEIQAPDVEDSVAISSIAADTEGLGTDMALSVKPAQRPIVFGPGIRLDPERLKDSAEKAYGNIHSKNWLEAAFAKLKSGFLFAALALCGHSSDIEKIKSTVRETKMAGLHSGIEVALYQKESALTFGA